MARYDDILEAQLEALRELAKERIIAERDYRRGPDEEETGSFYRDSLVVMGERFERVTNLLRSLLFEEVEDARAAYEPKLTARGKYAQHQLLHPKRRGFTLAEVLPNGPVRSYNDRSAQLSAAEAREAKVRVQD